jgi:hypothetical protein
MDFFRTQAVMSSPLSRAFPSAELDSCVDWLDFFSAAARQMKICCWEITSYLAIAPALILSTRGMA